MHGGELEEEEEVQRGERERDVGLGGCDREKKEGKGVSEITKMPLPAIFGPSCSILGITSLIHNPNSKPKIDNTTLHQLLIPKNIEIRFNG